MVDEKQQNYSFLLDRALEEKNIALFNSIPKEYMPNVTAEHLELYCKENNLLKIKYIIMFSKMDNVINFILVFAAQYGNINIIQYAIEHGADINFGDAWALRISSTYGHLETIQYLIKHGADITIIDNMSLTFACKKGYLNIVKYVINQGADIHESGNYPFVMACKCGQLNIVKYLIEKGISIKRNRKIGMIISRDAGYLDITEYLKSLKYKKNLRRIKNDKICYKN